VFLLVLLFISFHAVQESWVFGLMSKKPFPGQEKKKKKKKT